MPRHQVLTRLAKYFPVAWIDPPPEWRAAWKHRSRTPEDLPDNPDFLLIRPGKWLPRVYRPERLAQLIERERWRRVRQALARRGAELAVLYLWRPESLPLLDLIPHRVSCYHVDDEYSFTSLDPPVSAAETSLLARATQVIITSPGLMEKRGHLASRAALIPNGVDYAAFSAPAPEPELLRPIPRPRIGYIGVIKDQLNIPLLAALARRHPHWSFVLVGPVGWLQEDLESFRTLASMPNVHRLGPQRIGDLPGFAQHLDVGLMPYDEDGYTKYIYPLKLHEYLAAGLPIVATPIRTLLDFRDMLALVTTEAEWSEAIEAALAPSVRTPAVVARRQAIARNHDWDVLVKRLAHLVAEHLGTPLDSDGESFTRAAR